MTKLSRFEAVVRLWIIGLLLSTRTIHGFANNLIITSIGCMTELDTSEVIMNNVVKSAEESDFPNMHLAVLVDDKVMESPFHYRPAPGTTSADVIVIFVNPYTVDEFPEKNDLQFVIQLRDTSGGEPGTSAEFVSGGTVGCDGNQRVSSRWKDNQGQVLLQIHDISVSFQLWAGWATGQGAVRLTPTLVLEPGLTKEDVELEDPADTVEVVVKDSKILMSEEEKEKNREQKVISKKGPKGDEHNLQHKLSDEHERDEVDKQENRLFGHMKENKHIHQKREFQKGNNSKKEIQHKLKEFVAASNKRKEIHDDPREEARGKKDSKSDEDPGPPLDEEEGKAPSPLSKEQLKMHAGAVKEKVQLKTLEESTVGRDKKIKDVSSRAQRKSPDKSSFRRRYDKGVMVSTTSHFTGCVFFVLATGGIIFAFSKRREKGRRDL